jgi:hypothetical protein
MTIRNIHRPEILLEDLKVKNKNEYVYSEADGEAYTNINNKGVNFEKLVGLHNFFININGFSILPTSIEICTVNLADKYPTIKLRIQPKFDEFVNFGLPKDGDIITLFYRSTIEDFKPLRIDFIITDIKNEKDSSFVLFGVVNIPKLFNDSSFFEEDTSLNTLIKLSKEMKLGFSTNEIETSDKQNWLCANQPFDTYLEEIKKHAWKNERSFYDSFIDMYYNLNFINVFDQLSNEKEKKVNVGLYKLRDFIQAKDNTASKVIEEELEFESPIVLHNWKYSSIKEATITSLGILNESSRISLEEGYQKYSHFYDFTLDEKVELLNEAITSKGSEENYLSLKGNVFNDKWKENTRHIWSGISYSLPEHNVHPFYYQAQLHNEHNLKEIDKFSIQVTLDQVNFNLHRYMILPILWYEYGDTAKKLRSIGGEYNALKSDEKVSTTYPYILNEFISGFYVLKGFHLDYVGPSDGNPPVIQQRLILTRTEWPKTFIVTDADDKVVTNLPLPENG